MSTETHPVCKDCRGTGSDLSPHPPQLNLSTTCTRGHFCADCARENQRIEAEANSIQLCKTCHGFGVMLSEGERSARLATMSRARASKSY